MTNSKAYHSDSLDGCKIFFSFLPYKYGLFFSVLFVNFDNTKTKRMSTFDKVAFNYLHGIIGEKFENEKINVNDKVDILAITFIHELDNLGFVVDRNAYNYIRTFDLKTAGQKCIDILSIAKHSVGDHVEHKPMYPNFPTQVMEMDYRDLYVNAYLHYWTCGKWKPISSVDEREQLDELNNMTTISLITDEDVKEFFFKTISSKSSIPASIIDFVELGISLGWINEFHGKITFKETLCRVATHKIKQKESIIDVVETTTDILRIMASLSESDIELKHSVKFKSLPRAQRRTLIEALERVIKIEDVKTYAELWKLAFHSLHIGEYKSAPKTTAIANRIRNEKNVVTTDTIICEAIKDGDVLTAMQHLSRKPSEFARSLDKLLRDSGDDETKAKVLTKFSEIIKNIDSKVLLQLLGHFQNRNVKNQEKRVIVTPGLKGKVLLAKPIDALDSETVANVIKLIETGLIVKFKERDDLVFNGKKKVYISPETSKVLLPLQLASISENKSTLNRGSRIPIDRIPEDELKNVIRLFVYWVGGDIDLSAMFANEHLTDFGQVSYTNLRESYATHSGDIRCAPEGASEFIDIRIEDARKTGFRYLIMNVFVYSGPNFVDHETCFAGFMLREHMSSGEIYEPSTVLNKFDITSASRSSIPLLFDLERREVIWIDSTINIDPLGNQPNNLENNHISSNEILKSFLTLEKSKLCIPKLVELHIEAEEGVNIVNSRDEADFVVGLGEGDLNIYDFTEINSRWI